MTTHYPKVAQLKSVDGLKSRCEELGISMPIDQEILSAASHSPMSQSLKIGQHVVGNRWCVHPMEGWDANTDGSPTPLTLRRWRRFGQSGAKLIWGGEAAAVQPDGRANPRQTMAVESNEAGLRSLLQVLLEEHRAAGLSTDDLVVGLQLTHSGRFSRPHSKQLEPRIAYHHPLLDQKFGIDPQDSSVVWSDDDLMRLADRYVDAAKLAQRVGFHFVDVKACHGYLLHEFLSARRRPGKFGGDFEGRTRLLLGIIDRIHQECPGLGVGVRLSVFDQPPFQMGEEFGQPMPFSHLLPYDCGFGLNSERPLEMDLDEPVRLLKLLASHQVIAVNLTCGSPYYNPHIQRPAIFPPSDGYLPPEDPLVGVSRQIQTAALCKQAVPELPLVGTGYTYLQDFLPHVAQATVRQGMIDLVGLGRMVLSYPTLPRDTLVGDPVQRKAVCRTFSDCTTAPRNGIESGCYPLDAYYKKMPQALQLKEIQGRSKLSER